MPDPADYYREESGEAYHRSVHQDQLKSEATFLAKASLARHRYFSDLSPDARVFEFGVGLGTNLARLPNPVKHGFDVSGFAAGRAQAAGVHVFTSVDEVPADQYDLVLCRHVLEHVTHPADVLLILKRLLAPGGRLLLILPVERSSRGRTLPKPDVDRHLYSWDLQLIVNLLHHVGMRAIHHRYYWYSMQTRLRWVRRVLGMATYSGAVTVAGRLRRQRELALWAKADD